MPLPVALSTAARSRVADDDSLLRAVGRRQSASRLDAVLLPVAGCDLGLLVPLAAGVSEPVPVGSVRQRSDMRVCTAVVDPKHHCLQSAVNESASRKRVPEIQKPANLPSRANFSSAHDTQGICNVCVGQTPTGHRRAGVFPLGDL